MKNLALAEHTKISNRFSSSATTYRQGAQLQQTVGQACLNRLSTHHYQNVIDLGCGPGLFTNQLADLTTTLISIDLSMSMLNSNPSRRFKLQANSHQLPLRSDSIELVFSSLMIQWCDLDVVLDEIYRVLKPGGQAIISTLVEGTLCELKNAWSAVDNDAHIHQYLSLSQVKQKVAEKSWAKQHCDNQEISFKFSSPMVLARELKLLGANYVKNRKNKGLVTRHKWQLMEQAYREQCHTQDDIPATYQVVYIELEK